MYGSLLSQAALWLFCSWVLCIWHARIVTYASRTCDGQRSSENLAPTQALRWTEFLNGWTVFRWFSREKQGQRERLKKLEEDSQKSLEEIRRKSEQLMEAVEGKTLRLK